MEKAGIFTLARRWNKSSIRAPLYHRFSEDPKYDFVTREKFRQQILYARKAYRVIHPDRLFHADQELDHGIVITVDDGYGDFYEIAYPILRELSVPAIVYLTTDFIDGKTWFWFDKVEYLLNKADQKKFPFPLISPEQEFTRNDGSRILEKLKVIATQDRDNQIEKLSEYLGISIPESAPDDYLPLSWVQIREMADNGIAFGAHTCTHPILTQSEPGVARNEIVRSKERIEEELGKPVISFAYPNGDYSENIRAMVQDAGYEYGFSSNYGFFNSQDDRYTLNRMAIGDRPLIYFRQDLSGVDVLKQRMRGYSGRRQQE